MRYHLGPGQPHAPHRRSTCASLRRGGDAAVACLPAGRCRGAVAGQGLHRRERTRPQPHQAHRPGLARVPLVLHRRRAEPVRRQPVRELPARGRPARAVDQRSRRGRRRHVLDCDQQRRSVPLRSARRRDGGTPGRLAIHARRRRRRTGQQSRERAVARSRRDDLGRHRRRPLRARRAPRRGRLQTGAAPPAGASRHPGGDLDVRPRSLGRVVGSEPSTASSGGPPAARCAPSRCDRARTTTTWSRSSAARTAGCGSAIGKDCSRWTRPRRSRRCAATPRATASRATTSSRCTRRPTDGSGSRPSERGSPNSTARASAPTGSARAA